MPWDKDKILSILRQFSALTSCETWSVMMFCHNDHCHVFKAAFEEHGLSNIETVYWHKTGFNAEGNPWQFLRAVETIVVGHMRPANNGGKGYYMPPSPLDRHNWIEMKPVTTDRKKYPGTDTVVNVCEKPAGLGKWFCERFIEPEGKVVVGCAGAGGEVRGCLEAGRHVLAVDQDEKQMNFMREYFGVLDALVLAEKEKAELLKRTPGGPKTSSSDAVDEGVLAPHPDGSCPQCGCKVSSDGQIYTCVCGNLFCNKCGLPEQGDDPAVIPDQCNESCKGVPEYDKPVKFPVVPGEKE
jgi:hypothetical protein